MASYGQQTLRTDGTSVEVSADGCPEMKQGGVTVDWSTVTAVSADTVTEEGLFVANGEKFLRYGQVLCTIGAADVQTVTITGTPTGGTFVLTLPASGADAAQSTGALAFNATAAVVQAALEGLSRIGPGGVGVALAGAVYTVTFHRRLGDVPQLTSTNAFTGGTTPGITHATTTAGGPTGAAGGKVGPHDPAATDGRQTLARGETFILNRSIRELRDRSSDHPPALYGGLCFKARVIATYGTASLAAGPTYANLETAMPRVAWVSENPS
jgi:hypothetical protein